MVVNVLVCLMINLIGNLLVSLLRAAEFDGQLDVW